MKIKAIILSVVIFVPIGNVSAQIPNMGIKLGAVRANQAWHYSNNLSDPEFDARYGLDVGVFTELINLPFVALQVEGHYIQKGIRDEIPITSENNPDAQGNTLVLKPRIDYLSFPVLLKVKLPMQLSPYIIVGPRFDIKIGHKSDSFDAV